MNVALVLSGGTGSRLGADRPKQYVMNNGRMVIDYCLEAFNASSFIDSIWIVADITWQECIKKVEKFAGYALPGENRQLSIYNGLMAINDSLVNENSEEVNVMIHDAARPFLSEKLIEECIRALHGHDGVLPVLSMKDTVYYSEDGNSVTSLLDRSNVYAGQAPEVFRLRPYIEANEKLLPDAIMNINGSSEPAVMAGMDIAIIPGDENNFKITTKADFDKFRQMTAGEKR